MISIPLTLTTTNGTITGTYEEMAAFLAEHWPSAASISGGGIEGNVEVADLDYDADDLAEQLEAAVAAEVAEWNGEGADSDADDLTALRTGRGWCYVEGDPTDGGHYPRWWPTKEAAELEDLEAAYQRGAGRWHD